MYISPKLLTTIYTIYIYVADKISGQSIVDETTKCAQK